MKRFQISRRAQRDLKEIWEFIAEESFDAADRVRDDLIDAVLRLAQTPRMGHRRPDLTDRHVLFWPVHSYLIIYQDSSPLRIVRVIHGKRDVKTVLE